MPIKIKVPFEEKDEAKKLGATWIADEKTWVIPNYMEDIRGFKPWLPQEGGSIVKFPHVLVKSQRRCWKCQKDTPLIALGAKNYFTTCFNAPKDVLWEKYPQPVFFRDISLIHNDLVSILEKDYPFFQLRFSKTLDKNVWVNTCVHCQIIQPDNYNFDREEVFGFSQGKIFEGKKTELLKLKFDYHIVAVLDEGNYTWISGAGDDDEA